MIPCNSLYTVNSKDFLGELFSGGLLLQGILRFKIAWPDNKNGLKHQGNNLNRRKQLTLTVHGCICSRGLIIGRIYASEINCLEGLCLE